MVSVPYALRAADAETLGGKPASAFVTTGAGRIPAKVSVIERARVTAGLAKDVDAVNQYAAVMYALSFSWLVRSAYFHDCRNIRRTSIVTIW